MLKHAIYYFYLFALAISLIKLSLLVYNTHTTICQPSSKMWVIIMIVALLTLTLARTKIDRCVA